MTDDIIEEETQIGREFPPSTQLVIVLLVILQIEPKDDLVPPLILQRHLETESPYTVKGALQEWFMNSVHALSDQERNIVRRMLRCYPKSIFYHCL
jgi:hypothetical protein